jgi:predicted ABC-type ATPase
LSRKQLWLLAGGNGAGKTTFYRTQLQPLRMPFVNADDIAREVFPGQEIERSYEAARLAEEMRAQLLRRGQSFCAETVFSHPSKIDFVAAAKGLGYETILVFVHVSTISLNQARVHQRVGEGGHAVPMDKIASRIPRTLKNIRQALPLFDEIRLLDNSSAERPFALIATVKNAVLIDAVDPLPAWAAELLSQ